MNTVVKELKAQLKAANIEAKKIQKAINALAGEKKARKPRKAKAEKIAKPAKAPEVKKPQPVAA
jgi:hypothetical protein